MADCKIYLTTAMFSLSLVLHAIGFATPAWSKDYIIISSLDINSYTWGLWHTCLNECFPVNQDFKGITLTVVRTIECFSLFFFFCICAEAVYVTCMTHFKKGPDMKRQWRRVCIESFVNAVLVSSAIAVYIFGSKEGFMYYSFGLTIASAVMAVVAGTLGFSVNWKYLPSTTDTISIISTQQSNAGKVTSDNKTNANQLISVNNLPDALSAYLPQLKMKRNPYLMLDDETSNTGPNQNKELS